MVQVVNVHEAKTSLSRLLQRVERGEEIVIARNGQPVAKLVPLAPTRRKPGALKGRIWVADDFDATPAEVVNLFEGP